MKFNLVSSDGSFFLDNVIYNVVSVSLPLDLIKIILLDFGHAEAYQTFSVRTCHIPEYFLWEDLYKIHSWYDQACHFIYRCDRKVNSSDHIFHIISCLLVKNIWELTSFKSWLQIAAIFVLSARGSSFGLCFKIELTRTMIFAKSKFCNRYCKPSCLKRDILGNQNHIFLPMQGW